jgi:hypothetical protein
MDRLAFGTDNGQIYIIPALKLISTLFLNDDQSKENFGNSFLHFYRRKIINFFRHSNTSWS